MTDVAKLDDRDNTAKLIGHEASNLALYARETLDDNSDSESIRDVHFAALVTVTDRVARELLALSSHLRSKLEA